MNGWTYHVVLGNGTESAIESGPYSSATIALEWAVSVIGRTVGEVLSMDNTETLSCVSDRDIVIGYTIERYDGEQTDGEWWLNGGTRRATP